MGLRTGILLMAAATIILLESGCVVVCREREPSSWPQPVSAAGTRQYDGDYGNWSVDPKTGRASDDGEQLFDFITGEAHSHGSQGARVEIRSAPDGSALQVRLLDQQGSEIDSTILRRGVDFGWLGGALSPRGPLAGTHGRSSSMGAEVQQQAARLFTSSSSDLLGRQTESGGGLIFYFVPFVNSTRDWMRWPRLSALKN
jgi:hypothetical protein